MKSVNQLFAVIFYLCILSFSAFADKQSNQPTDIEHIEIFPDKKILAVSYENNKYVYHIGELNGEWSNAHLLKDLGLDYVTSTFSSSDGIYLIGEVANKKPGDNIYYTGRTVLLSNTNKIINHWDYANNIKSAAIHNNEIIGSTGKEVIKLKKSGEIAKIHTSTRKTPISITLNKHGELIICNGYPFWKFTTIGNKFGCYKKDSWEFSGRWVISNRDYRSDPVRCGNWLIEVEQNKHRTPFTKIKTRDINTGELTGSIDVKDVNRYICVDDKHIVLNTGNTGYSLPTLRRTAEYSCHKNEVIKSIKYYGNFGVCLTEQGNIGKPGVKPL